MEIRTDVVPTSWAVMVKADTASFDGWYWANYGAAPQPPVTAFEIGNPPIIDLSAVTSDDFFGAAPIPPVTFAEVWPQRFPAETYDHVVAASGGPPQFVTSDQCIGCHEATFSNSSTPNMLFQVQVPGSTVTRSVKLSPYGEWRASPMGLAGRDPIFFSQLQSEVNHFPQLAPAWRTRACTAMASWASGNWPSIRPARMATGVARTSASCPHRRCPLVGPSGAR